MPEVSVINEKELGKAIIDNVGLKLGVPLGGSIKAALKEVLSDSSYEGVARLMDTHYLAIRIQKDADGNWGIAVQANRKESI